MARAGALASLIAVAPLAACHDKTDDATTSARDDLRADAERVRDVLELDAALDRSLQRADQLATDGKDSDAIAVLEGTATGQADRALDLASGLAPKTAWGLDHKAKLVALVRDRKAAIPQYAAAIRSGDADARLAALEHQVDHEKRAIQLAADVRSTLGS